MSAVIFRGSRAWLAVAACLVLLGAWAAPVRAQGGQPFRLRELPKDRRYELRALYLEDERLPTLTEAQRRALYARIEALARDWFGYEVRVNDGGRKSLAGYFAAHEAVFQRHFVSIRAMSLDVDNEVDRGKLRDTIAADFRGRDLSLIAGYLRAGKLESKTAAVDLAQRQFLAQLREIGDIPVAGGGRLREKTSARLHSYPHWAFLVGEVADADFILTNSMIAGADTTMPIYVIARGGITTGVTNNNPRSAFQAASMVGLFPFLSDAPLFLRERGRIPEAELLDVIATMCLHELGHLLLRYAEYYDHAHCIHVAPPGLGYYIWHQAVRSGGPCRLPHRRLERF